jgi:hypothetical protein
MNHIIERETLYSILRPMIYSSLQPILRSCYSLGWFGVFPRGHTAAQKGGSPMINDRVWTTSPVLYRDVSCIRETIYEPAGLRIQRPHG